MTGTEVLYQVPNSENVCAGRWLRKCTAKPSTLDPQSYPVHTYTVRGQKIANLMCNPLISMT